MSTRRSRTESASPLGGNREPVIQAWRIVTNIWCVEGEHHGQRLAIHGQALVMSHDKNVLDGPRSKVTIMGADPAWPVATFWFPAGLHYLDGTRQSGQSADVFLGEGEPKPVFMGETWRWALDDWELLLFLQIEDRERPFDVLDIESDDPGEWQKYILPKVAEYHRPPYMPLLRWVEAKDVRAALMEAGHSV